MRQIKFRTPHFNLDGSFSHYSYWGAIDHKGNHSPEHDCFTSPSTSSSTEKGWHEQFTGLKDKNGVEIYFGDTLRFDDKWEWYGRSYVPKILSGCLSKEQAMEQAEQKPYEERTVESLEDYEWLLSDEIQRYWKVIGNIHE